MTSGIVGWGAYLPHWRLERGAIGAALGTTAGRGTRAVASYDEDTTTMGVEAARRALADPATPSPDDLVFSTPDPAYLDKTNATTIHAALGFDRGCAAYDACGSVRSAWAALRTAAAAGRRAPAMAVLSDLRTGLAGGSEESQGGDGATAFVFAPDGAVAELVGQGSATDEFLDRWRVPGEQSSRQWEDRFGEVSLVPLAKAAYESALGQAGVEPEKVDHLVVTGLHARAVGAVRTSLGTPADRLGPDFGTKIGNLGAAQAGVSLADALERAQPDQVIAVLVIGDGAECAVLRTTAALTSVQRARRDAGLRSVAELVDGAQVDATESGGTEARVPYAVYLSWRGQLTREPPRRPDPERPDAPAMRRNEGWKFGFSASRCTVCGFVHLPPTRVCLACRSVDAMEPQRLADVRGTVATYTIDHLAFSQSPPLVGAVIDFDGGGRYRGEMTDVDPASLSIGTRVEMTFRLIYTAQGVHNYFWKARPLPGVASGPPGGNGSASQSTDGSTHDSARGKETV